ncbi:unnamed protein product [Acanthoscelides obtectus]|uniref:C2H2-type domain-containing protein n=1 Tax=Acanthoscelides obtectus TaxID=200917 RepID=A0A9P0PS78_ACAOB|nr:unnamed protein product [Acanthoscelides obtectus]CAK1626579.1 Zinc finger protein 142 [Acanthoscelides obtectus]
MDHVNKKVKLDPDSFKGESQQEETPDQEDEVEGTLVEPCDEDIELEASCCSIKLDIEQEPVDATEYMVEINTDLREMEYHSALQTNDETKREDTIVKSGKGSIKDFICTTCNYITAEPLDFMKHWLSYDTQRYKYQNGQYICQISHCSSVFSKKMELLKHIAMRHLIRYCCSFCYYVTYSNEDFDEHSSNHFTYQCVKCDLESTKHFFVQNHLETPLKCELCDFKAYHWILYQKHVNMHRYPQDSIIECRFCGFTTGYNCLLKKHLVVHCGKFAICKMCDFTGLRKAELDKHYKIVHHTTLESIGKVHKCKFCTCKFTNLGSKDLHEKFHFKESTAFTCCTSSTTCPYCNYQDENIHEHIQVEHSAELDLEGLRCESTDDETVVKLLNLESFKTEDEPEERQEKDSAEYEDVITTVDDAENQEIEDPIEIYAEKASHRCPNCCGTFMGMKSFERHLIKTHKMTYTEAITNFKIRLLCKFCAFNTFDMRSFKKHVISDHPEPNKTKPIMEPKLIPNPQRYICPFCYYVTFMEDEFEAHCQAHTVFKCTECHFESTKRLFVEDHMDNPWACSKCGFKAHHWLPLKHHAFSHHNKVFALLRCQECNFETRKPGLLKTHLLTHTWAFLQCTICTYRTGSDSALKTHYEKCHDFTDPAGTNVDVDRLYECDFCDCKFRQHALRDRHRALHGENGPFNVKCSQCHTSKTSMTKDDNGKDTNSKDDRDGWTKCPYCGYKDEARYRMIDHLSQVHENELEIEGFRYKETTDKLHEKPEKNTEMNKTNRDHLDITLAQKRKQNDYQKKGKSTKAVEINLEAEGIPRAIDRAIEIPDDIAQANALQGDAYGINRPAQTGALQGKGSDNIQQGHSILQESGVTAKIHQPIGETEIKEDIEFEEIYHGVLKEEDADNIERTEKKIEVGSHNIQQAHGNTHTKVLQESEGIAQANLLEEADNIHQPIIKTEIKEEMIEFEEICHGVLKEEDADSIEKTEKEIEVGSHNIQQAHVKVLQESEGIAQANILGEAGNIRQPFGKTEIKEEIIEFEDSYHGVLKKQRNEKKVEAADFLKTETVEDISTMDAACSSSLNPGQNEEKLDEKGPVYSEQDNRWYCPLCPYNWKSNSYAVHHFNQKHKRVQNPLFKCAACRYKTKSWRDLSNHINVMHRAKADSEEIPCKQPGCKYKAPSVDELSRHMARHLQTSIKEVMKYTCKRCSFATVSDKVFKKHNCISTMNHECYDCGFKCETRMQIYHHIVRKHRYTNSKTMGFQCRKCGLASKDNSWREHHLETCMK